MHLSRWDAAGNSLESSIQTISGAGVKIAVHDHAIADVVEIRRLNSDIMFSLELTGDIMREVLRLSVDDHVPQQ